MKYNAMKYNAMKYNVMKYNVMKYNVIKYPSPKNIGQFFGHQTFKQLINWGGSKQHVKWSHQKKRLGGSKYPTYTNIDQTNIE